ncbi:Z1 domain-containing protein [Clostridium intestinale]|uniref:Z1 domain-containing protein n=1 Tax=Clostridium intestinale TaxID=36845 RepID=A0A7D7A2Q6_9CLOT|nr:Z1 domain-containing protein [Clostridium intestinale]QLY81795.1 Z1 domain-containing protein [Clostridium intestinale]
MVNNNNVKAFESIIKGQILHLYKANSVTEAQVLEIANRSRIVIQVSDEEFEQAIKNIHSNMSITMDEGVLIKGDEDYIEWYDSRRAEIELKFWNRYKEYLTIKKGWNESVVNTIDKVSNDIVALLGDPKVEGSWKRRGLVIGEVQSGKTANFTAICNKATDVGYDVIIILTGTIESLRKQTQERQDSDLVGFDSYKLLNDRGVDNRRIGVGEINKQIRLMTFTSTRYDFKSAIIENVGLSLDSCKDTALFVVKKNKKILENLEQWLIDHNANENGKIDSSVLIIDDESDNASVNTKEEENPAAINKCIRNLLKCFMRESYVAVTATPYANIFINDESSEVAEGNFGQDLFPKDFIYCLAPPSNYIGAKDIFLTDGKYYDSLEVIDDAEEVIPTKHKSSFQLSDIPDSLRDSVYHFILVNAIRDKDGDTNSHRSMLVNVSRFTNVQNQLADYLGDWLELIRRNLNGFACLPIEESIKNQYIKDIYEIWKKYDFERNCSYKWEEIRGEYLIKAIFTIKVQAVNQSTRATSLDYSQYKNEGLRVIAVGGNSLSRGLTLEGLCTTYFYRNSQAYDTLMQMGRWFGYRPGYENLFRIWMTPTAIEWYGTICNATEELKREISKMNRKKFTPKQFGLKVKEDPQSLIVTARNKMKHTKVIEKYIEKEVDISGRVIESVNIEISNRIIKNNISCILSALRSIHDKQISQDEHNGTILVKHLEKELVLDLISRFITPEAVINNLAYNKNTLIDYISEAGHLENWNLVIPSVNRNDSIQKVEIDGKEYTFNKIKRLLTNTENKFISVIKKNGRIITGNSLKIGLDSDEKMKIEADFKDNNPELKITDSDYLYNGRDPIIFIHFIDVSDFKEKNPAINYEADLFVAISLAFPKTENNDNKGKKARYRLNTVAIKQQMNLEEEDEE